jgi:predicted anti-sigma-YlaC factor YlaD
MTCNEVADFLMAYLDHELDAQVAGEFERHLKVCPPCRAYIDSYIQTIRMTRDAVRSGEVQPPPAPERLVRAIQAARGGSR